MTAPSAFECAIVRVPDPGLIRQAVRLHRDALQQGFITTLGEGFLRALYDDLLRRDLAFLVVAKDADRLGGFILGTPDATRTMSSVMRAPHRFVPLILWAVVRRPSIIARLLGTLSYGRKTAGSVHAELMVIAVQQDLRSWGIGRRMVTALDQEFTRRGVRAYKVTVYRAMTGANRFYVDNGFRLDRSFDLGGVGWNLYTREIA